MIRIVQYLFGPEVYGAIEKGQFRVYEPNWPESLGNFIFKARHFTWPALICGAYYVVTRHPIPAHSFKFFFLLVASTYVSATVVRALGRMTNRMYRSFLDAKANYQQDPSQIENRALLRNFDYEFSHWPADYRYSEENVTARKFITNGDAYDDGIFGPIYNFVASFVATVVARRLIYPGSWLIIQGALWPQVVKGRAALTIDRQGIRHKLISSTGDDIDAFFIDRRNQTKYRNGSVLMITCEGNAGFYELGLANTAAEAGYSVLSWNHPGFGGSSGLPWPQNECAAVDVVAQFAWRRLGFQREDTVVFAWSIGGFPAVYLAANEPRLRGLLLDAVFDDVLPLALNSMPPLIGPLVRRVIRTHFNLHVGDYLAMYDGPVLFIRRADEEIIVTDRTNPDLQRRSNRINFLVETFLQNRYPILFTEKNSGEMTIYAGRLASDRAIDNAYSGNLCSEQIKSYLEKMDGGNLFPSKLGEGMPEDAKNRLARFLIDFHQRDFSATHCVPLSANLLVVPDHPGA